MSTTPYSVGLQYVGAYQVSGVPFCSGSQMPGDTTTSIRFQFNKVSKRLTFKSNYAHDIRIHFAPYQAGLFGYTYGAITNNNFYTLAAGATVSLDVKCKEVFVSSTNAAAAASDEIQVFAELTNIPVGRMFSLDNVTGVATP